MSSSTTSFVPTVTSSAASKQIILTSKQIAIVVGLVALGLLILLSPVFVIGLRRLRRRKKYEQSEDDDSKRVDASESQEMFASKPSKLSLFNPQEADPFIEYLLKNPYTRPNSSVKDYYPGHEAHVVSLDFTQSPKDIVGFETVALNSDPPPTSSVRNYYGGHATHQTHVVSLDFPQSPKDIVGFETVALHSDPPPTSSVVSLDVVAQSPKDNIRFETVALHSYRPNSSSKSTIKLPPLIIPSNIPMNSNGDRSAKATVSRKPSDSGYSEDSASLYSVPSVSASSYLSRSSLETIKPPPVPPIPAHLASPTLSTFSRGTDVTVTPPSPHDEESFARLLPPLPSFPRLSLNGEEDETDIYNVAKLLQTRLSKLPRGRKDSISRNASMVSHIERSGSISAVISPTDEESYRPRYYRLKQKKGYQGLISFESFAGSLP